MFHNLTKNNLHKMTKSLPKVRGCLKPPNLIKIFYQDDVDDAIFVFYCFCLDVSQAAAEKGRNKIKFQLLLTQGHRSEWKERKNPIILRNLILFLPKILKFDTSWQTSTACVLDGTRYGKAHSLT